MIAVLLFRQIVSFFIMMAFGFTLVKTGLLRSEDSRILSIISIYIIIPCVMIDSFQMEYSDRLRDGFLLALFAAVVINGILLIVVRILRKPFKLSVIERASLIYSNAGNLVIPLVMAVLGEEWVIYAAAFMGVQNIMLWTHGQSIMRQSGKFEWKKLLLNVNLISIAVGIALFFAGIRLPNIVENAVGGVASTLGPVSMVMLGMVLAGVNWKETLTSPRIYVIMALKMLLLPLIVTAVLKFFPFKSAVPAGETILLITQIGEITPSAAMVVQLAQINGREVEYAGAINLITTIVCIATMPLMVLVYYM